MGELHETDDGECSPNAAVAPAQAAEPPRSTRLLHLLLRPRVFFQHLPRAHSVWFPIAAAWIAGVATAMEMVTAKIPGKSGFETLDSSWTTFWLVCLLGGVARGVIVYFVGGWWYRVLLRFSGERESNHLLARRVNVYAQQFAAVAVLAYMGWQTFAYPSPVVAANSGDFGWLFVIAAMLWSIYAGYVGAGVCFNTRPWPRRMLFGALPLALLVLSLGWGAGAEYSAMREGTPDLANRVRIERGTFAVEYPANWEVDTEREDYDPDSSFRIGPPLLDAWLHFTFYEQPMDSSVCADALLKRFANREGRETFVVTTLSTWGRYDGVGHRSSVVVDGTHHEIVSFCSTEGERPFAILQACELKALGKTKPGWDLIRDSLWLRPVGPDRSV